MIKHADTTKIEKFTDLQHMQRYAAAHYADKKCYTYKRNGEMHSITFREHTQMTNALGTAFYNMGLMGSRIALLCESRYEWSVTYLAAVNGGGVIVPIDKEINPEQLIKFIERAEASAVVYSSEHKTVIEAYAKDPGCKVKCFINMDYTQEDINKLENTSNIYSFAELAVSGGKSLAEGCAAFTEAVIDPKKMCVILFTSGTTGTSKAVMLSHMNMASSIYDSVCCVSYNSSDRLVSVLPIHHTYEATCGIFATYALGCEVCINDSLKMISRNFKTYQPTALVLVPLFVDTIVKKIWEEIDRKGKTVLVRRLIKLSNALRHAGIDLRRVFFKEIIDVFGGKLRLVVSGGAPLNPAHIPVFDAFGIELVQGYGTTECAPLLSVVPSGWQMKKKGSAGYPVFGVELKIDMSGGDKYGEVLARGNNVMLGYMGDAEATSECMTYDGFYRTGDIGYLDEDGFLYITGRKKNVIVLNNGKNVYPEEIEEYLNHSDLINECAVIARSKMTENEKNEIMLCALIYPDFEKFSVNINGGTHANQQNTDEIQEAIKKEVNEINKKLPTYKHINIVEIRETEFEKTASKKIIRNKLR